MRLNKDDIDHVRDDLFEIGLLEDKKISDLRFQSYRYIRGGQNCNSVLVVIIFTAINQPYCK